MPTGDVSPPEAAPNRRCQARPFGPPLRVLLRPVTHHSCDVVAIHCGGGVTLTASNCPIWIPNLNYALYSCCCPLLYPSQPAGSISSCLQPTLTEVTHFVDPRSGSLVTLGHATSNNNMRDIISNGISDSRICDPFINNTRSRCYLSFITVTIVTFSWMTLYLDLIGDLFISDTIS